MNDFIIDLKEENIEVLTEMFRRSLYFYLNHKGYKVEVVLPEDERFDGESTTTFYPTKHIEDGVQTVLSLVQSNNLLIKLSKL